MERMLVQRLDELLALIEGPPPGWSEDTPSTEEECQVQEV